jgi:hypothetical protein
MILAIVFSGMLIQAQENKKASYCRLLEKTMHYNGVVGAEIGYRQDVLIITIPMDYMVKNMNKDKESNYYSANDVRNLIKEQELIDLVTAGFIEKIEDKSVFYAMGFYKVQFVIKDDFYHFNKKYKSKEMKV